ncbi:MAG: hypothetical protein JWP91_3334 [Fibrobacteres bacterium]|nr:hypothetical protein [Fibrobacterota bacterium]
MKTFVRNFTLLIAAGILVSHASTEGTDIWSNHAVDKVEVIANTDPYIQFTVKDVANRYFRIYLSQNKIFNSFLAGLLSAKSTGQLITVNTTPRVTGNPAISLISDSCSDCEIIFQ